MSESESKLSTPTQDTEAHPSRTALLGQASRFLKQDEIKNASTEKKIDFLQSKGLTDGETHRLLGLSSKAANANAEKEEESIELSVHQFLPVFNLWIVY